MRWSLVPSRHGEVRLSGARLSGLRLSVAE